MLKDRYRSLVPMSDIVVKALPVPCVPNQFRFGEYMHDQSPDRLIRTGRLALIISTKQSICDIPENHLRSQ